LEEAATGREAKPTGPMDVHELIGEGGPAPGDRRRVREAERREANITKQRITRAGRVDRFCGSRSFWI
jgi:hypothetical protein